MPPRPKKDKTGTETGENEGRKRGHKRGGKPGPVESGSAAAGGRAGVVKNMLTKLEAQIAKDQMKATVGDYIRLVQLHKELDDESPKEIKVTWVEPARSEAETEKESGKEE
jgi:hypothetical protein